MSSILKVDQLQDSGGNNLVTSNGSGVITSAGFGKVGQVVQGTLTSVFSSAAQNVFVDIGLSASITPTSTSSKILVDVTIGGSGKQYPTMFLAANLLRGSTVIFKGDDGASNHTNHTFAVSITGGDDLDQNTMGFSSGTTYLDSPASTSAQTYKIQVTNMNNTRSGTFTINRAYASTNQNYIGRCASSITLTEILP